MSLIATDWHGRWCMDFFWDAIRHTAEGPERPGWTRREQASYTALLANTHWPQARQAKHDPSRESLCQLCRGAEGTLWHRRYECPASEAKRRQNVSAQLLRAARNAKAESDFSGECFAKGLFPTVRSLLPRPVHSSDAQVFWINRPDMGRMTGLLFTDGSAAHPAWPELSRAGWAVVQVDRFGNLVAAAYGPVPRDEGPSQVARDGEDYAVFIGALVATAPFKLHIDCAGTLDCVQRGPVYAAAADNPRAHLWTN